MLVEEHAVPDTVVGAPAAPDVRLLDPLAWLPPYSGGARREERSPEETSAANLVLFLLPAIDVCMLLFGGLGKHPKVAALVLPLAFGALAYLVCRYLRIATGYALQLIIGCTLLCAFWGVCAIVLSVMARIFLFSF